MTRRLTLTAVAIATVLAIAIPAQAATVTITDAKNDANALNDQGLITDSPVDNDNPGNGNLQIKEMDILSVNLTTTTTQLVVKLNLKKAPTLDQTIYRVTGNVAQAAGCTTFFIQYTNHAEAPSASTLRTCDPDDITGVGSIYTNIPVKIIGKTIEWKINYTTLQSLGVKNKNMTSIGAHDRMFLATAATGGATIPQVDQVASTRSIKLGL